MGLTVTQRPEVTSAGETSKWNAVGNPVLYKMQRKDFSFNQINNSAGFMQLQFNGVDITGSFANGDSVYVQSDDLTHDLFTTVTGESFSAGNTLITLAASFVSNPGTGFLNNSTLRPSYRVEVELYNEAGVMIGVLHAYSPTAKGAVSINVAGTLKNELYPDLDADLTAFSPLTVDNPVFKEFFIKYREVWTGSAEAQTSDTANRYFGVFGARQIPAQYGGNLFEFVTWDDGSPLVSGFLTKFTNLKVWRGYPNILSFISGSLTGDANISLQYYNAANVLVGNNDATLTAVNKVLIVALNDIIAIPSDAVRGVITIRESSPGVINLSNSISLDVVTPCENAIMLIGRNSLGGVMQWCFGRNQELSLEIDSEIKTERLKLFAENITRNEYDSLQDFITNGDVYKNNITELASSTIKTSTKIGQQVYILATDGSKMGVLVINTKNTTRTIRKSHNFELVIEKPEQFYV